MKKLYSIFLFCVLIAPFGLPYIHMHYEKFHVRKEVKRKLLCGIDKKKLACLKFSQAEVETKLNWKHAKEFEYENKMYDVVYTQNLDDTIFYWCLEDHEETALNNELKNNIALALGASPQNEKNKKVLNYFFKQLYQVTLFDWTCFLNVELISYPYYLDKEYTTYFLSFLLPPEKY